MLLELACNASDAPVEPPIECDQAIVRSVGGRPEKADPLIVAMGRGHLIGEAKALGWQYIPAGLSVSGEEMNICPVCWAKRDWSRK
jgi:hypothetical protein